MTFRAIRHIIVPMDIFSRQTALSLGLKQYFPGTSCSRGHVSEKRTSNYECIQCKAEDAVRRHRDLSPEARSLFNVKIRQSAAYLQKRLTNTKRLVARERNRYRDTPNYLPRKKAVEQGLTRYFTGRPCKNGHIAERSVRGLGCLECQAVSMVKFQAKAKQNRSQRREDCDRQKKIEIPGYVSKQEAKTKRLSRYFTGEPCYRGHLVERSTGSGECLECQKITTKAKRQRAFARDPERVRAVERAKKRRAMKHNPEPFRVRRRRHRKTATGQLRKQCERTALFLELGSLSHSRFDFLDYGPDEFMEHMENTLGIPNISFSKAKEMGYHLDHIVPISFISSALPGDRAGRILAFRVAMDLANLRMIPGNENQSKGARLDLNPEQAATFDYLCKKYRVAREMAAQAIPY